jgi:hypothetical protein
MRKFIYGCTAFFKGGALPEDENRMHHKLNDNEMKTIWQRSLEKGGALILDPDQNVGIEGAYEPSAVKMFIEAENQLDAVRITFEMMCDADRPNEFERDLHAGDVIIISNVEMDTDAAAYVVSSPGFKRNEALSLRMIAAVKDHVSTSEPFSRYAEIDSKILPAVNFN